MRAHWHNCRIASQPRGELVVYSRDEENTVNILNYKTFEILHVVTVSDLNSVDAITVAATGVVYLASYESGPVISFELTTGQMMRQITGGNLVQMTATLETTPDAKYLVINMYQNVEVWDLFNDKVFCDIYHPTPLNTVSLGSSGRLLVTAGFDYLIPVYHVRRMVDKGERST